MATVLLANTGKNPVIGDDVPIRVTLIGVPSGTAIVEAWATFKRSLDDLDAAAIVQLDITGGFVGTTTVVFTLTIPRASSALFTPNKKYLFDVQVKDSIGNITTPIPDGEVTWQKGATDTVL